MRYEPRCFVHLLLLDQVESLQKSLNKNLWFLPHTLIVISLSYGQYFIKRIWTFVNISPHSFTKLSIRYAEVRTTKRIQILNIKPLKKQRHKNTIHNYHTGNRSSATRSINTKRSIVDEVASNLGTAAIHRGYRATATLC